MPCEILSYLPTPCYSTPTPPTVVTEESGSESKPQASLKDRCCNYLMLVPAAIVVAGLVSTVVYFLWKRQSYHASAQGVVAGCGLITFGTVYSLRHLKGFDKQNSRFEASNDRLEVHDEHLDEIVIEQRAQLKQLADGDAARKEALLTLQMQAIKFTEENGALLEQVEELRGIKKGLQTLYDDHGAAARKVDEWCKEMRTTNAAGFESIPDLVSQGLKPQLELLRAAHTQVAGVGNVIEDAAKKAAQVVTTVVGKYLEQHDKQAAVIAERMTQNDALHKQQVTLHEQQARLQAEQVSLAAENARAKAQLQEVRQQIDAALARLQATNDKMHEVLDGHHRRLHTATDRLETVVTGAAAVAAAAGVGGVKGVPGSTENDSMAIW